MTQEEKLNGKWENLPNSEIFVVHAALLHTGKVLLFSGGGEVNDPLESRLWDPATAATISKQVFQEDIFCSGHAFLPDGRLLVTGGTMPQPQFQGFGIKSAFIFNPVDNTWTKVADMKYARWYPTTLTLMDGKIITLSGRGAIVPPDRFEGNAVNMEVYDPLVDKWNVIDNPVKDFPELYPSIHLLPSGRLFYSRAGWGYAADENINPTSMLDLNDLSKGWVPTDRMHFPERKEGIAVIMIDASVSPVRTNVLVIGGGDRNANETEDHPTMNPKSCEIIDVTLNNPNFMWKRTADMNFRRTNVNAVLLPDGTVFVVGGRRRSKWERDPDPVHETEIYDPQQDTWTITAKFQYPHQYHSIALLLPDASVLVAGGVDPGHIHEGHPEQSNQRFIQRFNPPYLFRGDRPVIEDSPNQIMFRSEFEIRTPNAHQIESVALLHLGAITHHTDPNQRYIRIPIVNQGNGYIRVNGPENGNIAPPGYYMLFIVNNNRIPSISKFIQLQ